MILNFRFTQKPFKKRHYRLKEGSRREGREKCLSGRGGAHPAENKKDQSFIFRKCCLARKSLNLIGLGKGKPTEGIMVSENFLGGGRRVGLFSLGFFWVLAKKKTGGVRRTSSILSKGKNNYRTQQTSTTLKKVGSRKKMHRQGTLISCKGDINRRKSET